MSDPKAKGDGVEARWVSFRGKVLRTGKNTTGIPVPEQVLTELGGGKRPLIWVKLKGFDYRSAVGAMGKRPMIPLSAANRKAAGVKGGEELEVNVKLDLEPRTVELPGDLKAALVEADALGAFEKSAPSMKKEYVRQVEDAKAPETRQRRIAKIVKGFYGG